MAAPSSPLVLLLPGRPLRNDFVAVSPTRYMLEIPSPVSVPELAIALAPGATLLPHQGLVIYYSAPPFDAWTQLGVVSAARPSVILRTGWPGSADVAAAPAVRLGVSVEDAGLVANLERSDEASVFDKLGFAQLVASDLFTWLGSFAQVLPGCGERLVVPPSAMQQWLVRVTERFRRDPNWLSHVRATA